MTRNNNDNSSSSVSQKISPPERTRQRQSFASLLRQPATVACVLGGLGTLYRLVLLLIGGTMNANSDESTMGLMALHISKGEDFPIYIYGQHYMGALEAYRAVPLFWAFGPSTFLLRLPNLAFFIILCVVMYQLVSRLYTPWFATLVIGFLALGGTRVVGGQLLASGGYPELVPMVAGAMLLAVWLAKRPSAIGYFSLGLLTGLVIWDDWLGLPYVGAAWVLLMVFRWRDLLTWAGVVALGGLVVGLIPVVIHDLSAIPQDRIFSVVDSLRNDESAKIAGTTFVEYVRDGVMTSLPLALGLCPAQGCSAGLGWIGLLVVGLIVASTVLALIALVRGVRSSEERVAQAGRVALAAAALATIVLYAKSPTAVLHPTESARYLSCLLVSVPVMLWPLWVAISPLRHRDQRKPVRLAAGIASILVVGIIFTLSFLSTIHAISYTADVRRLDRSTDRLIAALDEMGIHRMYTEYWVCNQVAFASRENVICANVSAELVRGHDRIISYRDIVDADPAPAYVFLEDSLEGKAFQEYVDGLAEPVPVTTAGPYRIYVPTTPLDVPTP